MTQISEAGRTRLYTRRQRRRIRFGLFVALVGAVGAGAVGAAAASWLTGDGWQWPALETRSFREGGGLFSLGTDGRETPGSWRFPITVDWPEMDPRVAVVIAAVVWAGWLFLFLYPVTRGLSRQTRHRGLARRRRIRSALGARAARRAGRFTRPRLSRWQRFLLPTNAFGYRLLRPTSPKSRRWVWADWEQRIRIIARTGWGKGARLLIPMIRALPGPALISSTEPGIFTMTVQARTHRRDPVRWPWLRFLDGRFGRSREYPVAVVDFSDPAHRWAAGYPQVRWNPIPACLDHTIAHRRAAALVAGVDNTADRGSDSDRFFRSSATEVLAAWLHAAALGDRGIDDLLDWMAHPDDPTPTRILEDHPDRGRPVRRPQPDHPPRHPGVQDHQRCPAVPRPRAQLRRHRRRPRPLHPGPRRPGRVRHGGHHREPGAPSTCWPTPTASTGPDRCSASSPPRCSWPPRLSPCGNPANGCRCRSSP